MSENVSPVILTAMDLSVSYGEQIVLDKASLTIHEGDRIGLVGRNGAGKSTFLKILSGAMQADSGEVAKRKDLVIGFLSQEFTLDESLDVHDAVISGAEYVLELLHKYEALPPEAPNRHELEEKILHADGWNIERNAARLIASLHAPEADRKVSELSGGEKRRVALCKTLISQPDLLILDEPTNHLDTGSIEWIEEFLASYAGTCIFVTHDRYFLDRLATRIVELSSGTFYSHQGNYTDYMINKAERQAVMETEEKKRQSFLRRELDWVMRGPRARRTKAKSRLDAYYEASAQPTFEAELDVELIIPTPPECGKKILELIDVSMEIAGKKLFTNLNFIFQPGRKLGVVGRNGAGKTTLLKIMLHEMIAASGNIATGEKTVFNYIDQNRSILNDEDSVYDAIGEGSQTIRFGNQQINIWTYLRRFLFTDDRIRTKVGKLSGGERSRLSLAMILKNGGNFLILDEPTNDLDLPTLRILEEALIAFNGCVVVVSHDRYFLNRVCNGILAFEDSTELYFSEGDYDYYIEKRNARRKAAAADSPVKEKKDIQKPKLKSKPLSWKETKELEGMEENIMAAEEEVEKIEKLFSAEDFYAIHGDKISELTAELEAAKQKVKSLYDRWAELEAKASVGE